MSDSSSTSPWLADDFPPVAPQPFNLDLDEATFAYLGEVTGRGDLVGVAPETRLRGAVVVNRPDEVWHVLGSNYTNYLKGIGSRKVRMLLGKGLIANEGEPWRQRRRLLQPHFHRDAVRNLVDLMLDSNRALVDRWCEQTDRGEPIDVSTDTARLTLEIMVRCLFGDDLPELIEQFGDIPFALLTDDLDRSLSTVHQLQRQREQLKDLIARRRSLDEQPHDLLGILVGARDEETGEPLSDLEILDEVVTLAVAGHETSASALTWCWWLLSEHPEIEARLHEEVDALEGDAPTTSAELRELPYSRRVLDEVLRLYPPGWILTRKAIDEDRIGGHRIPAGTDVVVTPYYLHRHPEFWPDPERFDPDRFLEKPAHKHAYIPFGAGPRKCIGDIFGLIEMQLHLVHAARRLKLRYLGEGHPRIEAKVNLRPADQLMFRAELR